MEKTGWSFIICTLHKINFSISTLHECQSEKIQDKTDGACSMHITFYSENTKEKTT
jgi:hypothetical protein